MNDEIKHKMFTDPVTLVTESQFLMLVETLERSQALLHNVILSITNKDLMTAELLELLTKLHGEQHWALHWAADKIKSLGSEIVDDRTEGATLQ